MRNQKHLRRTSAVAMLVAAATMGAGAGSASADSSASPHPLKVRVSADFETVGWCAGGLAPLQEITGTGRGGPLGRFEVYGVACLANPTNVITWTAANGDSIAIEYYAVVGVPDENGVASIAMPGVSAEGTGRFADVFFPAGQALAGTVWFADPLGSAGHLETSLHGTIVYDASDRSGR